LTFLVSLLTHALVGFGDGVLFLRFGEADGDFERLFCEGEGDLLYRLSGELDGDFSLVSGLDSGTEVVAAASVTSILAGAGDFDFALSSYK